ncbi:hypothetical protein F66182_945 [Fusarium sp. NRRL 66182]|nr:hypothetical protein F66182_945 [Fusarium sp. NRRL 66182]
MAEDLESFKRIIAQKNLERLSRLELIQPPPPSDGADDVDAHCNLGKTILEYWTSRNKESIEKAIKAQAQQQYIEWQGSKGKDTKRLKSAIDLYLDAASEINQVAEDWNMEFIQICDLPDQGPDKQPSWSGPYCGVFVTKEAQKDRPFMGLVFKGTKVNRTGEIQTDINYQLKDAGDFLKNQQVSEGVYTGLFTEFEDKDKGKYKPYNHIAETLGVIAQRLHKEDGSTVRLHVTGHSLGGSYSSLCTAQLLIDVPGLEPHFKMGDEYTFGAPRVGSDNWANMNAELMEEGEGQMWRIVNRDDLVTDVPPTDILPYQGFYHVDNGFRIFKDAPPEPIQSERNGPPPKGRNFKSWEDLKKAIFKDDRYHFPHSYRKSLRHAIQSTSSNPSAEESDSD